MKSLLPRVLDALVYRLFEMLGVLLFASVRAEAARTLAERQEELLDVAARIEKQHGERDIAEATRRNARGLSALCDPLAEMEAGATRLLAIDAAATPAVAEVKQNRVLEEEPLPPAKRSSGRPPKSPGPQVMPSTGAGA